MCLISAVALLKACDWPSGHSAASGLGVLRKWVVCVCGRVQMWGCGSVSGLWTEKLFLETQT